MNQMEFASCESHLVKGQHEKRNENDDQDNQEAKLSVAPGCLDDVSHPLLGSPHPRVRDVHVLSKVSQQPVLGGVAGFGADCLVCS